MRGGTKETLLSFVFFIYIYINLRFYGLWPRALVPKTFGNLAIFFWFLTSPWETPICCRLSIYFDRSILVLKISDLLPIIPQFIFFFGNLSYLHTNAQTHTHIFVLTRNNKIILWIMKIRIFIHSKNRLKFDFRSLINLISKIRVTHHINDIVFNQSQKHLKFKLIQQF